MNDLSRLVSKSVWRSIGRRQRVVNDARDTFATLQVLRVIAATCVLAGHWSEPYMPKLLPQGQLSIDVFFAVEGFLAERAIADGNISPRGLVLQRFCYVYPVYLLSLAVGFCSVIPFVVAGSEGWSIELWLTSLLTGITLLPLFSPLVHGSVFPLNPPSWAIVLEIAGFVMLAFIGGRRRVPVLALVWSVALLLQIMLAAVWHDPNAGWSETHYWGGLSRMAFSFFGGAILYRLYVSGKGFVPKVHPILIWLASLVIQLLTVHLIAWPLVAFAVPSLVLLGAASARPGWLLPLGRRAEASALAIYLLGFPIMIVWRSAESYFDHPSGLAGSPFGFMLLLTSVVVASELVRIGLPKQHELRGPAAV